MTSHVKFEDAPRVRCTKDGEPFDLNSLLDEIDNPSQIETFMSQQQDLDFDQTGMSDYIDWRIIEQTGEPLISHVCAENEIVESYMFNHDWKIALEYIGEGWHGDYNPDDSDDEELLRLTVYQRDHSCKDFIFNEEIDHPACPTTLSTCTQLPTTISPGTATSALRNVWSRFTDALDASNENTSPRHVIDAASWLSPDNLSVAQFFFPEDKQTSPPADAIYVVTMFEKLNESETGFPDTGETRTVGWFKELADAQRSVEANKLDINEGGWFAYCLIEKSSEGFYAFEYTKDRWLYKFNENLRTYEPIDEPSCMAHVVNFGIG